MIDLKFNEKRWNVHLVKPTTVLVPWIYVKDHEMRFPNKKVMSVQVEGTPFNGQHIGFVCETDDGWVAETDFGPMFYDIDQKFLDRDTAIRAVMAKYVDLIREQTGG